MGLISRVSSRTYRSSTKKPKKNMLFNKAMSPALRSTLATRQMTAAQLKPWKSASFVGVPIVCLLVGVFVWKREQAHWAHWERPDAIDYPWLSIRRRPLPWDETGKRTLFHNKQLNRIVGQGYEEDYKKPSH